MASKNGNTIDTDNWTIAWDDNGKTLDCTSKHGKKHTRLCGDPHIVTDGAPEMDFPTPTCSFALDDNTLIVADAPAANQPLNDLHVFTNDGQHFALGESQAFDDVTGTLFLQQQDGSFNAVVSRAVGTSNPNPVPNQFRDVN